MSRLLPIATLGVAMGFATACTQVYNQPPAAAPGPVAAAPPAASPSPAAAGASQEKDQEDEKKGPFKAWDSVLKDTRAIDGLFRLHLKRDNTLFLEISLERLDEDFGLVMHHSRGVGDFNLHDGLWLSLTRLMRFRRAGDKIYLVHRNPRFTADPGSPMRASLDENVGHSIVAAFKIESEHAETKDLLVDVTSFFVSDYAGLANAIKRYYGNKPISFDKNRSYIGKVMGFPRNVEIDAELTFKSNNPPRIGGAGVSDFRSIPVGVRYSLFALPEQPMRPRLGDDRVGHFLDAIRDFSRDRKPTPYVRYVNRWRLEKKDHSAAVSEPIQPIVYYIDRTVPLEYRKYVREGIEGWNKAFEAAGFKNAIVAREAPDDSTWSAEDIRYSTVRWTAAHRMGYAVGPSETDPRTGEILNADILISSEFVTSWLNGYQRLAGPDDMLTRFDEAERLAQNLLPHLAERICIAQLGKQHQMGLQYALLVGLGVVEGGKPMPEEYLGDALRDLVMHEVGHTLGLRHNFKGSSGIPYNRLQNKAFTREHGLTLSVMDYGAVNIAADPARQGHYWNKEVGTYDVWAIEYAHAPIYEQSATGVLKTTGTPVATPEAELVGLRKIAQRAAEPLHAYGTDEDRRPGPFRSPLAFAVDPLTNVWDLGSDPMVFAQERAAVIKRVQPNIERRLIAEGEGYQRLRGAVDRIVLERLLSLRPVVKTVGGLHFARDHKGDPKGRLPFTPVPAEKQRQAVQFIIDQALAENAFEFDPELLNKLAPNRWLDWNVSFSSVPVDYPLHDEVLRVQNSLLRDLLHPARLGRMIENELRVRRASDVYPVSELFTALTSAIWSELGTDPTRTRSVDSFRRNLQRAHIRQLTTLLITREQPVPEDARSLARYELTQLSDRIAQVLASGASIDTVTRAHLAESKARIDKALEASLTLTVK